MKLIKKIWHLPVVLMMSIYLPASILGVVVFRDEYAADLLLLLVIFLMNYYGLYRPFQELVDNQVLKNYLLRIGDKINWRIFSWMCVFTYLLVLFWASVTVIETPIEAALRGGDWLDIATARGNLFVNRQGADALLRYLSVILGRTIMPLLLTYLFWTKSKSRYWALAGLLCCYGISLEKASSIFAFFPIILISLARREWLNLIKYLLLCLTCISIWTYLSMGGVHQNSSHTESIANKIKTINETSTSNGYGIGRRGDPQRHHFFNFLNAMGVPFDNQTDPNGAKGKLMIMTNRILWIPYVTAYDWLKFGDEILNNNLTMGRSIGMYAWITDQPKMEIEKMVYEYEFGVPEGGAGSSNTVFLVDAKISFGWIGVFLYCAIFTFCSAVIFSSRNDFAKYASFTCFFTATVSSLTATLLSGGLFFLMLICLLYSPDEHEAKAKNA